MLCCRSGCVLGERDDPGLRFPLGTFSFVLAHIAYTAGFAQDSGFEKELFTGAAVISLGLSYSLRLLGGAPGARGWTIVPSEMTLLVRGYIGIIALMVTTATATGEYQRILGARILMSSDCFVAFDTFGGGKVGWKGRAVGWTAHFGAQLLFVGCVGGA